jgi:hypothetical protein
VTVHLPIERALGDAHGAANDAVNRWRGHCVERYARLEYEVTGALSAMAAAPDSKVTVPHNFGEKVKKLRAAIDPGGPFARSKLAKALDNFSDHLSRRNMLVHATGKAWIDGKGEWLWRYRFQPSGKGRVMEIGCFEQGEALEIEKTLARDSQSLGGQLRALRQKLEGVPK